MPAMTKILDHKDYWDEYLPLPLSDHGLVMRRGESGDPPRGTVKTNVPHRVEWGSPDGFEFGYGGSGPSDLALNAVEHIIWHLADEGVIEKPSVYYTAEEDDVHAGRVSELAFRLAPEFKAKFIAPAPMSGGTVEYEVLKEWVVSRSETKSR